MRDIISETVEVRGGKPESYGRFSDDSFPRWPSGQDYLNVGGYALANARMMNDDHVVELRQCGMDTPPMTGKRFNNAFDANTEYERLKTLLTLRAQVIACMDVLVDGANVLPADFVPHIRAGEFSALLIAADWQDDHGEGDKAMLLRAAYHRLTGEPNVKVKACKKTVVWLNVLQVGRAKHLNLTPFDKVWTPSTNLQSLFAATVEENASVRIISINDINCGSISRGSTSWTSNEGVVRVNTFAVGDQAKYDSYNLCYFGSIKTITAKTVTVDKGGSTARMKIDDFVCTNYNFDLVAATKRNNDWSD
jgi:hypothetical protein